MKKFSQPKKLDKVRRSKSFGADKVLRPKIFGADKVPS